MWTCPKCSKKVDDAFEICWACGTSVDGVEDPHFLEEIDVRFRADSRPSLPPENWVTVAKCFKAHQAHAMRVQLESDGIPVAIFDEFSSTLFGSSTIVEVQVPEAYLQQARDILGIVEDEEETGKQPEHGDDNRQEEMNEKSNDAPEEGIIDKVVIEGIAKPPHESS